MLDSAAIAPDAHSLMSGVRVYPAPIGFRSVLSLDAEPRNATGGDVKTQLMSRALVVKSTRLTGGVERERGPHWMLPTTPTWPGLPV